MSKVGRERAQVTEQTRGPSEFTTKSNAGFGIDFVRLRLVSSLGSKRVSESDQTPS